MDALPPPALELPADRNRLAEQLFVLSQALTATAAMVGRAAGLTLPELDIERSARGCFAAADIFLAATPAPPSGVEGPQPGNPWTRLRYFPVLERADGTIIEGPGVASQDEAVQSILQTASRVDRGTYRSARVRIEASMDVTLAAAAPAP